MFSKLSQKIPLLTITILGGIAGLIIGIIDNEFRRNPKFIKKFPQFRFLQNYAIEQNCYAYEHIDLTHKNKENSLLAIEKGLGLQYVPYYLRSYKVCYVAVKRSAMFNTRYVPYKIIEENDEIYTEFINQGQSLEKVPKKYRKHKVCLKAIENSKKQIDFVPKKWRHFDKPIRANAIMAKFIRTWMQEIEPIDVFDGNITIKQLYSLLAFSFSGTTFMKIIKGNDAKVFYQKSNRVTSTISYIWYYITRREEQSWPSIYIEEKITSVLTRRFKKEDGYYECTIPDSATVKYKNEFRASEIVSKESTV